MKDLFKIILIETHNHCNRKCGFCKFGQDPQDSENARMLSGTIDRIINNLQDLECGGRASWLWINEPLLDKRTLTW